MKGKSAGFLGALGALLAARVSPAGLVSDISGIQLTAATGAPGNSHPRAAWDGAANFRVVWADSRNASLDIYGARVVAALDASSVE